MSEENQVGTKTKYLDHREDEIYHLRTLAMFMDNRKNFKM